MSRQTEKSPVNGWLIIALGLAMAVLLFPLTIFVLALMAFVFCSWVTVSIILHLAMWAWWSVQGKDVLFVTSDSPIWHDYIEQAILPLLGQRAVILNWSRRQGRHNFLARCVVQHFGGWYEFNPMAVVFRPFRKTKVFRFWKPFRDFKHRKPEPLKRTEDEFFACIGVQRRSQQTDSASADVFFP
jgi:hypothetical protein